MFAFNDEAVARAIAACRVPVVSAVGHEVDVTIADLVADVRAATPSNAAELVVPEYSVLTQELGSLARALQRALEVHLGRARLTLDRVTHRLMDPRRALFGIRSRLDTLRGRMIQATHRRLQAFRASLKKPSEELVRLDSRRVLARNRASWTALTSQLRSLGKTSMVRVGRAQLTEVVAQLHALSPLAILARGYSITLRSDNGSAITSIRQTAPGELVRIRLHEGALQARIEEVLAEEPRS